MKIHKLDAFGEEINFFYNNNKRVKSTFGGIVTIIMAILLAIGIWFIGNDIIYKRKPFSNLDTLASQTAFPAYIHPNNFTFALINMNGNNSPIYDPTYYELEAQFIRMELNAEGISEVIESVNLPLAKCVGENFPYMTQEEFDSSSIGGFLCLDPHTTYILSGGWGESKMTLLRFQLKMCDWDAKPDFCKS